MVWQRVILVRIEEGMHRYRNVAVRYATNLGLPSKETAQVAQIPWIYHSRPT